MRFRKMFLCCVCDKVYFKRKSANECCGNVLHPIADVKVEVNTEKPPRRHKGK